MGCSTFVTGGAGDRGMRRLPTRLPAMLMGHCRVLAAATTDRPFIACWWDRGEVPTYMRYSRTGRVTTYRVRTARTKKGRISSRGRNNYIVAPPLLFAYSNDGPKLMVSGPLRPSHVRPSPRRYSADRSSDVPRLRPWSIGSRPVETNQEAIVTRFVLAIPRQAFRQSEALRAFVDSNHPSLSRSAAKIHSRGRGRR